MAAVHMVVLFLPCVLFIYVMADAGGKRLSRCTVAEDCESGPCITEMGCPVGECREECGESSTLDAYSRKCIEDVDVGGSCEHSNECKTSGATCSGGICKCATGRRGVYDGRYCASENDKLLGEPCGRGACLYKLYSNDGEFLSVESDSGPITSTDFCKGGECACPDGSKRAQDGCSPRMVGEECKYFHDCGHGGCVSGNCECLLGQKQVDNRCVSLNSIGNQGYGEACARNGITLDRMCQKDLVCVTCPVVGDICTNGAAIVRITAVWWSIWWTIAILYLSM